jgi:TonB family protein
MRALCPTSIGLAIVLTVAAASAAPIPAITVLEPIQNARIYRQEIVAPNGGMSPPRAIQFSAPGYTPEALASGIEGVVTFVAEFDRDGNFTVLHMAKGLGYGLDEKALEALLQWRFAPAFRSGRRVGVIANIDVSFHLPIRVEMKKFFKLRFDLDRIGKEIEGKLLIIREN